MPHPMAELTGAVLDLVKNRDTIAAQRDELRTIIKAAIAADPDSIAGRILQTVDLEKSAL